jgi:ATP/maltotriose-dependent transcriptional regulator MalT
MLSHDTTSAIDLLSEMLEIGVEGPQLMSQLHASSELAIVHALEGRLDEAESHLARSRAILAAGEDWSGLAVRHVLAEAATAAASGQTGPADEHFAVALAGFRRLSLPWDEAEALELWALTCQRFHRGRVRQAFVREKLDAARAIYLRIGAGQPWIDRVDRLVRSNGAGTREAELPDRLTSREAEVLRLVAAGRSNAAIANALVLSVRTVERHITTVYSKIGVASRAAATAYAIRHGLVND